MTRRDAMPPVALDHAVGDVVPARHDGELVENLLGDQRLAAFAVARPEAVAQLVAKAVVTEVVELEGVENSDCWRGRRIYELRGELSLLGRVDFRQRRPGSVFQPDGSSWWLLYL
jgi:hypothetical protein